MDKFINICNLNFSYSTKSNNSKKVLKNINLDINKGEFIVILGKNGCGKSTLVKHLNGLLIPMSGDVIVDGVNTKNEEKAVHIRKKVGMVFQNPDNQIVSSIVEEDVAFGPENLGMQKEKIIYSVNMALESVGMLEFKKHEIYKLSGGQKQRIAIAGVIAMEPECIVLDEPTSMLDPKGRREVIDSITRLNKEYNKSIIMITHDIEEAFNADRIIIMEDGEILLKRSSKEIFSDISYIKSMALGLTQSMELIYKLEKHGIKLPFIPASEAKCIEMLTSLLGVK